MTTEPHLILGSKSPQRKKILASFSVPFEQIPSDFDERIIPYEGDPVSYANVLAQKKAEKLSQEYPTAAILTADSVVYKDGKIYNKPDDATERFMMLQEFNGGWQFVFTAVTARLGDIFTTECAETRILFHNVSEEQLLLYDHAFAGHDKAGGYCIQGAGSLIINRIEGCFYNVVGLPITETAVVLKKVGIDLWHYLSA